MRCSGISILALLVGIIVAGCPQGGDDDDSSGDDATNDDADDDLDDDADDDSDDDADDDLDDDADDDSDDDADDDLDDDLDDDADDDDTAYINYAIHFPTASGNIVASDSESLRITGTQLTLEAMVKVDELTGVRQVIAQKMDQAADNIGYSIRLNTANQLQFLVADDSQGGSCTVADQDEFPIDGWHHIAGTFNNGTCRIFIDGFEAAIGYGSIFNVGSDASDFYIGHPNSLDPGGLIGSIDEIRVSTTDRYYDEFFPEPTFDPDDNTAGLWHFIEGEGVVAVDGSGNHNTGTLHDAEWIIRE